MKKPNERFPGLPDYTGPNHGYFAMLHHEVLFENTKEFSGGVEERVNYVRAHKPRNERGVRLRNILYIGDLPILEALSILDDQIADKINPPGWMHELRERIYSAIRPQVLAYIKKLNRDHSWVERAQGCGKVRGTR